MFKKNGLFGGVMKFYATILLTLHIVALIFNGYFSRFEKFGELFWELMWMIPIYGRLFGWW